ncbi:hypothetical protein M1N54_01920, partial [Thermodesulfovibrionales bacterium]|nr:hypothetical protein [Thermodesulfovibrionales bacterium]
TYVMYITGIGRMAADTPELPFRFAGWIFHIHTILIPTLILLFIWSSDKARLRKHFSFGIILLLLHGVSGMLLLSSRGAMLISFMLLMMLFLVTGTITKKRMQLFGVIVLATIILFPIISHYRYLRAADLSAPIVPMLTKSINTVFVELSFFFETVREAAVSILLRFTGAGSLFHITGANLVPLYTDAFNISVTRFFTVDVIGFSPEAIHGSAPSFLGWFYLVGGNGLVLTAMFGFTVFVWTFWRLLSKLKLRCLPVAQALFLWWTFSNFSEGVLDRLYLGILVMVGSIFVCEWIARTQEAARFLKVSTYPKAGS